MTRSLLGVAHSARRSARSAAEAAERGARAVAADPLGLVALGVLGTATAAAAAGALVVGAHKLYELYTPDCENQSALEKARELDSKDDTAKNQAQFDELQENWTQAAALYLEASKGICPEAQYALGRLCFEGRGYVYDPEFGLHLYGRAAAGGNIDAQYALACIALREALGESDDTASESLYEASSLLLLARKHKSTLSTITAYALAHKLGKEANYAESPKKASYQGRRKLPLASAAKAVDEFNRTAGDPRTWARSTEAFLDVAAEGSDDARAQAGKHDAYGMAREWKGNGGWRARLAQCAGADLGDPDVNKLVSELVSDTLERAEKGSADPREAALVAQVCLPADGDSLNASGELTKKARVLLDYAADKGDESAVMLKIGKIGKDSKLSPAENAAEFARLLHATCTAAMVAERGNVHWQIKTIYEEKNDLEKAAEHTNEAKKDWEKAAALGAISAMSRYRESIVPEVEAFREHGVGVVPMAAALAMTVASATPVLPSDSLGSDVAVWRYIGLNTAPAAPKDGTARTVDGAIHVAWPNLGKKKNGSDALHALEDTYTAIVTEIAKKGKTEWGLLVQPTPKHLFGKYADDAPVMTARAILRAVSSLRKIHSRFHLTVTMCVFDPMSVVCEYDRAFQACIRASPSLYPQNQIYGSSWEASDVTDVRAFIKAPRTARVALILGCGKQPGGSLSKDGWSVDLAASPQTQEEIAVSEWLQLESEDDKERVRVFRATIAATRDSPNSVVIVHCETLRITLVFARFEGGVTDTPATIAASCVENALSAIPHRTKEYQSVHVSIGSFAERVPKSQRASVEAALKPILERTHTVF